MKKAHFLAISTTTAIFYLSILSCNRKPDILAQKIPSEAPSSSEIDALHGRKILMLDPGIANNNSRHTGGLGEYLIIEQESTIKDVSEILKFIIGDRRVLETMAFSTAGPLSFDLMDSRGNFTAICGINRDDEFEFFEVDEFEIPRVSKVTLSFTSLGIDRARKLKENLEE